MKLRMKYSKTGAMKFIGHLDLIRTFQKVFRIANIPIAYSQGFNPHPILSVGAPLAVGVTSIAEYLDIKITTEINLEQTKSILNNIFPEGLKIMEITRLNDKAKTAMAVIDAAKYRIQFYKKIGFNQESVDKLMAQPEILIQKITKKKKQITVDIKPGIININLNKSNDLILLLATGSKLNIKHSIVLEILCKYNNITYNASDYFVQREELYYIKKNSFIPLNKGCSC